MRKNLLWSNRVSPSLIDNIFSMNWQTFVRDLSKFSLWFDTFCFCLKAFPSPVNENANDLVFVYDDFDTMGICGIFSV